MNVSDWEVVPAHHHPARKISCLVPKSTSLALFPVGWKRLSILDYKNSRPHVILCPDLNSVENFSPLRSNLQVSFDISMVFSGGNGIHLCHNVTSVHLQNFPVSPRWSFRPVTAVVLNPPNSWDPFIHTVHIVVTPAVTLFLLLLW